MKVKLDIHEILVLKQIRKSELLFKKNQNCRLLSWQNKFILNTYIIVLHITSDFILETLSFKAFVRYFNKRICVAIKANSFLPYRHFLTKHLYLNRNSGADSAILFAVTNPTCILYLGNPNKSYQSQQNSNIGGKNIRGIHGCWPRRF